MNVSHHGTAEVRLLLGPLLIGVLVLVHSAFASIPKCQASIQGQSAVFFIENRLGNSRIEWFKETSSPGEVEYMWNVTLGNIGPDGSFSKSDKRIAFMVIRRANSKPSRGDLEELLRNAVGVAWNSQSETIESAKMRIGKFRDGVILGTRDPETFYKLFADRPRAAEIEAFLSAAGTNYSCVTEIEYE